MKIKNIYFVLCSLVLTTISISVYAKKRNHQNISREKWYQEYVEEFLDEMQQQTPSQISSRNLNTLFEHEIPDQSQIRENALLEHDKKIELLNSSLADYIKKMYNNYKYASYISQNGEDLLILLKTVRDLDIGVDAPIFSQTILKLFHEKFKQCELVDDTVANQILRKFPDIIGYHFAKNTISPLKQLKSTLKKSIIETFTSHLPLTQSNPTLFSSLMSKELVKTLKETLLDTLSKQEERLRLQNLIIRLLENIIGKIMWSHANYESFIPSLSAIANGILMLVKYKIIEHADDYDSLLWSLTQRGCFFLELCGPAFPLDFFKELETVVKNGEIPFLEEEEQDGYIRTKKEMFLDTIIRAKTQAVAYHREGIISSPMY